MMLVITSHFSFLVMVDYILSLHFIKESESAEVRRGLNRLKKFRDSVTIVKNN